MYKLIAPTLLILASSIVAAESYNRIGNTVFGSDGSTHQIIGNTIFSSDGKVCNKIGSSTFCN